MKQLALAVALACSPAFAQYVRVQDEGSNVSKRQTVNFTGAGVTCADNTASGTTICTIPSAGTAAYSTVQDEGTPLTQRSNLNFIGGLITCLDDGSSTTNCTLSLTVALGGTGQTAAPGDDQVLVGNGTTYELKTMPACAGPTDRLTYDVSTNSFLCSKPPLPMVASGLPLPKCNPVRRTNCK